MRFIFNFSWGGRPPIETEDESIVMEDECGVDKILDDDEPIETKDDSSLSTAAIEPTTTTTTSTTTLSNHDDTQGNNNIILDAVGNFARSAASTLGHRLKFTKILSAIDTINKSSSVGLNSISQEEEEGRIKLPRVVVIGDESAGKSSTLERVAMAGVLPRSENICTREPIVLKLRKDMRYPYQKPVLKLTIPSLTTTTTKMTTTTTTTEKCSKSSRVSRPAKSVNILKTT